MTSSDCETRDIVSCKLKTSSSRSSICPDDGDCVTDILSSPNFVHAPFLEKPCFYIAETKSEESERSSTSIMELYDHYRCLVDDFAELTLTGRVEIFRTHTSGLCCRITYRGTAYLDEITKGIVDIIEKKIDTLHCLPPSPQILQEVINDLTIVGVAPYPSVLQVQSAVLKCYGTIQSHFVMCTGIKFSGSLLQGGPTSPRSLQGNFISAFEIQSKQCIVHKNSVHNNKLLIPFPTTTICHPDEHTEIASGNKLKFANEVLSRRESSRKKELHPHLSKIGVTKNPKVENFYQY